MSAFYDKARSFTHGDKNNKPNYPIQVGHIILPPNSGGKAEFERLCRLQKMYSVYLENNTVKHNCPVGGILGNSTDGETQCFRMPEKEGELGERVLLLFPEKSDIPIIVCSLPGGESNVIPPNENSKVQNKIGTNAVISTVQNPDDGSFTLSINQVSGDVSLNLNVESKDKSGKLRLNVNGDCEIYAQQKIDLLTNKEFELRVRDLEKEEKFHSVKYTFADGLTILDKWENLINLKKKLLNIFIKDKDKKANAVVEVQGNIKVKATKKINIDIPDDKPDITIGNAESMALNESCICQFTGLRHLKPITNKKTKV